MSSKTRSPAGRDDRILTLLNSLGERLARSEKDQMFVQSTLEKYNRLFDTLETKAANNAETALTVSGGEKSPDTENLRAWQKRIEQEQTRQAAAIARTEELSRKIEEALQQQGRLNARLEKIADDRARLLRKLESIEDTIIETRNTLHARDTLLLAAAAAGPGEVPIHLPAAPLLRRPSAFSKALQGWENRTLALRIAGVTAFAVLAACGAFAALHLTKHSAPETVTAYTAPAVVTVPLPAPLSAKNAGHEMHLNIAKNEIAAAVASAALPVPGQSLPLSTDLPVGERPQDAHPLDVMTMNSADLKQAMDSDPDAVATALNQIEPEMVDATDTVRAEEEGERVLHDNNAATPQAEAPKTAAPKIVEDDSIDAFVRSQAGAGAASLPDRIKPDTRLPPVVREIEKKAFEGVPEAQHDLAAIYTAGHAGVAVDYERAAAWFTEAALNGVANARYNLGVLYHQGLGVPKDIPRAINWYRAAAKLGHPEAEYNLGIAYIEGIGTPYDARSAATYFESAARSGVTEAAYNLGLIYENELLGEGEPGPREALYWYKRAAAEGSREAQSALEQLARTLNVDVNSIDTAVDPKATDSKTEDVAPAAKPDHASAAPVAAPVKATARTEAPQGKSAPSSKRAQDQAMVTQVQEQLIRLGLYPGPADGMMSPQTEDAIRAYQNTAGLDKDGKPTENLLVHMLTSDIAPAAGSEAATLPH